jgi:hypothetical protein
MGQSSAWRSSSFVQRSVYLGAGSWHARWFVFFVQTSEKVPDLQVPRRERGGLTPVFCGRAVQTLMQTFAGPVHPAGLATVGNEFVFEIVKWLYFAHL